MNYEKEWKLLKATIKAMDNILEMAKVLEPSGDEDEASKTLNGILNYMEEAEKRAEKEEK